VEGARFAEFDLAVGQHDQQAQVPHSPREVMQQKQAAAVGPVHVVDEHQCRGAFAQRCEEDRDVVEDTLALSLRLERQIRRNVRIGRAQGRRNRQQIGIGIRREIG
jgi:hypothetical protein